MGDTWVITNELVGTHLHRGVTLGPPLMEKATGRWDGCWGEGAWEGVSNGWWERGREVIWVGERPWHGWGRVPGPKRAAGRGSYEGEQAGGGEYLPSPLTPPMAFPVFHCQ